MINQLKHIPYLPSSFYLQKFGIVAGAVLLMLIVTSCTTSAPSVAQPVTVTNTPVQATPTTQPTPVPQAAMANRISIKVYFSNASSLKDNPANVSAVERVSPDNKVGTFAIQQLIAGPTASEKSAGYVSALHDAISGPSTCGSDGFSLTLNKKGTIDQQGTATLKFCRTITSAGVGTDARIQSEIDATLKQFPSITQVMILTNGGHCFGDESGNDLCLK